LVVPASLSLCVQIQAMFNHLEFMLQSEEWSLSVKIPSKPAADGAAGAGAGAGANGPAPDPSSPRKKTVTATKTYKPLPTADKIKVLRVVTALYMLFNIRMSAAVANGWRERHAQRWEAEAKSRAQARSVSGPPPPVIVASAAAGVAAAGGAAGVPAAPAPVVVKPVAGSGAGAPVSSFQETVKAKMFGEGVSVEFVETVLSLGQTLRLNPLQLINHLLVLHTVRAHTHARSSNPIARGAPCCGHV
jgi:hypothetical protein